MSARPSRRLVPVGAVALAAIALAGACSSGGSPDPGAAGGASAAATTAPAAPSLTIRTFAFQPSPLTIERGATVRVENRDDIAHSITSGPEGKPDGRFDHELAGVGATADVRFDEPGAVTFHCSFHPGMTGTVEVR